MSGGHPHYARHQYGGAYGTELYQDYVRQPDSGAYDPWMYQDHPRQEDGGAYDAARHDAEEARREAEEARHDTEEARRKRVANIAKRLTEERREAEVARRKRVANEELWRERVANIARRQAKERREAEERREAKKARRDDKRNDKRNDRERREAARRLFEKRREGEEARRKRVANLAKGFAEERKAAKDEEAALNVPVDRAGVEEILRNAPPATEELLQPEEILRNALPATEESLATDGGGTIVSMLRNPDCSPDEIAKYISEHYGQQGIPNLGGADSYLVTAVRISSGTEDQNDGHAQAMRLQWSHLDEIEKYGENHHRLLARLRCVWTRQGALSSPM